MGFAGRLIMYLMPVIPKFIIRWVAKRYVAGHNITEAINVMKRLSSENACFTVDVLGEEISSMDEVSFFQDEYSNLIDEIIKNNLDANISLKPTAFGLLIDESEALKNIERIVRKAANHGMFVRLDMEDHRVTQRTIDLVLSLHEIGLENVGTVFQARLFRTEKDIVEMQQKLAGKSDIRICKGIYLESNDIAHTSYRDIVNATNSSIDLLLDCKSYTAIASHDIPVIEHSLNALKSRGFITENNQTNSSEDHTMIWGNGKGPGYEFQMLLGVRGDIRRKLSSDGHRTRIYLPYGKHWYEYSMRRLRENPDVAWHVAKSLVMPWTNRT